LPGNRYDTVGVEPLIKGVKFDAILADKAFDANWIISAMNERGAKIVISQRPQRTAPLKIDEEIYKWRHLIENFFAKIKEFKGIAMRSEKTGRNYSAMIFACAAVINLR
jgi:transposase